MFKQTRLNKVIKTNQKIAIKMKFCNKINNDNNFHRSKKLDKHKLLFLKEKKSNYMMCMIISQIRI